MKILLLTTQPNWQSWEKKLAACRGGLEIAKNLGESRIDLETYRYSQPPTAGGKIDRAWFNKLTIMARKRGYQGVVLHFSREQSEKWGIRDGLRGSTINDEVMGEMWLSANEHDRITYDDGRRVNRFVKVFLHECSHWFAKRLIGQQDKTHYWDYERHNVALAFTEYTFKKGLIDSIIGIFIPERLITPLESDLWATCNISQGYAVENDTYASGIHNGVDLAVPVGTKLYAPTDGRVTRVWERHKTMGNACLYEFYWHGRLFTMRCLHLRAVPTVRSRRRGSLIGYTGNTGMSTGAHLHVELWRGGYDVDVLYSKQTVLDTLVNPFVFFNSLATK